VGGRGRRAFLAIHKSDYDGKLRGKVKREGRLDTYFVDTHRRVEDAELR